MNPDALAAALAGLGGVDESYLVDNQIPTDPLFGSVMLQPSLPAQDVAEEAFFQPDDIVPWGTLSKAGLLGLALAGIKPVARVAEYLPDAVKLAQKRVVEPVVGAADDAATVAISDMAREMAENADAPIWYHGTGTNIEDMPGQSFRLSAPEQSSVPVVMGTNNWVTAEEFAPGSMDIGADLGFKYALEGGKPGGVYALKSTAENPLIHDAAGKKWFDVPMDKILREAKEGGREAVIFKNIIDSKWNQTPSDVIAWLNPARIRAVTAAMDPAKRESDNIFAGVAPLLAPTALAAALSQFGTEDQ